MEEQQHWFTPTQIKAMAQFRAELNGKDYYGVYNAAEDMWEVYDTFDDEINMIYEQPDEDIKDDDVEWYDEWLAEQYNPLQEVCTVRYINKAIVRKQHGKWSIYYYRVYDSRCSLYLSREQVDSAEAAWRRIGGLQ